MTDKEPKAYTAEEAREMLLNHMRIMSKYWATVDDRPCQDKLNGLCFSILNIFDGTTMNLPSMDIVLRPHPDDKQYHIDEGNNYFEDGMVINDDCSMHEEWYD